MAKYYKEIRHDGLQISRTIRGTDYFIVMQKVRDQQYKWEMQWEKKMISEANRYEREMIKNSKEENKKLAEKQTIIAQKNLENIENILINSLKINFTINWNTLKDKTSFPEKPPTDPDNFLKTKPERYVEIFLPDRPNFIEKIFPILYKIRVNKNKKNFQKKVIENEKIFQKNIKIWEEEREWCSRKDFFIKQQQDNNKLIDNKKADYEAKNPNAIFDYFEMVLSSYQYLELFQKDFELEYRADSKIMIIEYSLPTIESLPTLKNVTYISTTDKFKNTYLTESQQKNRYDKLLYEICLITIYKIFQSDLNNNVDAVSFNGWVKSIDKSTGQDITICILSLQTSKIEFNEINLAQVDPKACFRKLKGVGSSQLHSLSAIQPILQIEREDQRFVDQEKIVADIDESVNLASMDWEDFEHLVREIFEQEFSINGGEVKITRASRDGGVDAIAFDPDPIRGGKIVIQAKRYTNVVGVSAVRDLYGTVLNEGATKGILVTTSNYGPDSYEFAKGKPLTLLSGSNLLHLLQKHGHRAKIDINEAKKKNI
ncbi:MAG: restriction endonuclease [Magnetococcus sp. DMHC-6]